MWTTTLTKPLMWCGFISLSACTLHVPFQSNEGKVNYHLRQAVYHDPTLADSTEEAITIPIRNHTYIYNPSNEVKPLPLCEVLIDTLWLTDTAYQTVTYVAQDSTGNVVAEVECPPITIIDKDPARVEVQVPFIPLWVWYAMGVMIFLISILLLTRR